MVEPEAREEDSRRWFALTIRHRHERRVETALSAYGVEAFAPAYRTMRRWTDRIKEIEAPLFPGYVFGRFARHQRLKVMQTPGVAQIVGFGGVAAEVPEQEILSIRTALASQLPLRPWPHLRTGDRVRIEDGPMRGVEGLLLREKTGLRLVLGVELLQRSVAVEVDQDMIVPVHAARAAVAFR
jgi:transcription antitermination factor NusG